MSEHLELPISLAALAAAARLSPFHFLRAFKESLGLTPGQYVLDRRIEQAKFLLANGDLRIAAISVSVGFAHSSHFTRAFRRKTGVPPSVFRNSL